MAGLPSQDDPPRRVDVAPNEQRISDFIALRWEGLSDEDIWAHSVAVAKAFAKRFGRTAAIAHFTAIRRVIEARVPS